MHGREANECYSFNLKTCFLTANGCFLLLSLTYTVRQYGKENFPILIRVSSRHSSCSWDYESRPIIRLKACYKCVRRGCTLLKITFILKLYLARSSLQFYVCYRTTLTLNQCFLWEAPQHEGVTCNRPSSKNPHFQNEAKCTTFLVKVSFICTRMKNQVHIKGWALRTSFWNRGPRELKNDLFTPLPNHRAECKDIITYS